MNLPATPRRRQDPLSVSLILFTGIASGWGFFGPDIYRDNLLVRSAWFGTDLVTLLIGIPLLTIGYLLHRNNSPRGTLLWLGMLAYTFYNYAFYAFGASFNRLFLLYVAILVLSTIGLIKGLTAPGTKGLIHPPLIGRAHRAAGLFIITVSLFLGIFWISVSADYIWTGRLPEMVTAVEHPTNITAILDLWLVVSFGLISGIWLWRKREWGYILSGIWAIKGSVYMAALSAATITGYSRGAIDDLSQLFLWVLIGAGSIISTLILLRSLPGRPGAK